MKYLILIILVARTTCILYSQPLELDKRQVLFSLGDLLVKYQQLHFTADLMLKEFGSDTFDARRFTVSFKDNPDNALYGYDFEIAERFQAEMYRTIFTDGDKMFFIDDSTRIVIEAELPDKVELGSYIETLRGYFIWLELIELFLTVDAGRIDMVDSSDRYILMLNASERATIWLYLDKVTLLPDKYRNVLEVSDLGLEQILEVKYRYEQDITGIPVSAFNLQWYMDLGYSYRASQDNIISDSDDHIIIERDIAELIMNYLFVSDTGDTVKVSDYDGKYILLDFWFASCLPCLQAMPELDSIAKLFDERTLKVLGLNCIDFGIRESLSNKLRGKGISMPFLFGHGDLLEVCSINIFPTYYLLGPNRELYEINDGVEKLKELVTHKND